MVHQHRQARRAALGWLNDGRPELLAHWLLPAAGFSHGQSSGGVPQARQGLWALDDVVNSTEVLKQEREDLPRPDESLFYSLFLEGCKWDKPGNKLTDSDPKVFSRLPVLRDGCARQSGRRRPADVQLPLLQNPKRTGLNFIFAVDLRSERPASGCCRVCLLTATGV